MSATATAEGTVTVVCTTHPDDEVWVVCSHTRAIKSRRLVEDNPPVVGDALCIACRMAVDEGRPQEAALRIACGGCVRPRWPLEQPS